MKQKICLQKRLLSLVLILAVCLSLTGVVALDAVAEEEVSYHSVNGEIYLPLKDLTDAAGYNGSIWEKFNDTDSGGTAATNLVMMMRNTGEYVEYNFDLADDVTAASLKLLITNGKVEVKPAGGEFTVLTAKNGSSFNHGAAIYTLNESNALSGADNKFTVRISYAGGTTILNGLLIQTKLDAVDSAYTMEAIGRSYLRNLYDVSSGAARYFLNGSIPTVFIHNGEHVTLHYKVADGAEYATVSYAQAGKALTCEVSTDRSQWTTVASGAQVTHKDFYVRFTAKNGDAFLQTVTVTPKTVTWEQVKGELYLPIKDLTGAAGYSGAPYENFNDTYWDGRTATNLVMLLRNVGEYVEYNFDLADDVTAASLKLAISNGKVEVKPKDGQFTTLTAKNGTGFNRGAAIYALDETNALSGTENKFTVRINYDGRPGADTILNGLLLQTEEAVVESAHTLGMLGQDYLSALYDQSAGVERYFLNTNVPTLWLNSGEYAVFHFRVSQKAEGAVVGFEKAGAALNAEYSTDGNTWKSFTAGSQIDSKDFYVRFTAANGDAFLSSLKVSPVFSYVEEKDYVYLKICDLSNASRYGGTGLHGNFEDTFTGGNEGETGNETLLLQQPGDYVEYDFNLSDSCTAARLKVYMTDAVVSVKPYGGEFRTLTAVNEAGGRFERGVAIYDLTTANALSHESRCFTVRIACNGSATAVLNGLLVDAANSFPADTYTLEHLGESYLQGLWETSQSTSRYFDQGQYPTVFLQPGGYATFRMNFAPGGAAYLLSYKNLGTELTVEVSLDNTNWVLMKGRRVERMLDMKDTGTYYVRFTSKVGESFLTELNASREETEPPVEENANPKAPVDVSYVYFKAGTSAEEKYMFGTGDDYKASFNSTHQGMDIDGFEGGYSTSLRKNARIFHGGSVTYEFDLKDTMTSADLKVYGLAGMDFLISTDNGEIYEPIRPSDAPTENARGYYIFRLDETNALKNTDNKFRLQIKGTFGVLMSLMIENGAPGIGSGVHFQIDNENSLRYLTDTKGLRTYYADKAFANYYLDKNSEMIFRVPISGDPILYATYCGDLQIAVASSRNGRYTSVLNSKLGTTGTPHTNTIKLTDYIGRSSVVYIRIRSNGDSAFLDSFGISTHAAEKSKGSISAFTGSEAKAIYSINNNAQGIGMAKRVTSGLSKARGIDVGGEIVYRLDLPDDAGGVDVLLKAKGQYDLSASVDGETFYSAVQLGKKDQGLRILEPLVDSEDKVFYLKITNMSASEELVLYGLEYTTEGVPNYARPESGEFDYGKDLPDSFPKVEKLEKADDPDAYLLGEEDVQGDGSSVNWIWTAVIGGVAVMAVLLVLILLLARKKKKQA